MSKYILFISFKKETAVLRNVLEVRWTLHTVALISQLIKLQTYVVMTEQSQKLSHK